MTKEEKIELEKLDAAFAELHKKLSEIIAKAVNGEHLGYSTCQTCCAVTDDCGGEIVEGKFMCFVCMHQAGLLDNEMND